MGGQGGRTWGVQPSGSCARTCSPPICSHILFMHVQSALSRSTPKTGITQADSNGRSTFSFDP